MPALLGERFADALCESVTAQEVIPTHLLHGDGILIMRDTSMAIQDIYCPYITEYYLVICQST